MIRRSALAAGLLSLALAGWPAGAQEPNGSKRPVPETAFALPKPGHVERLGPTADGQRPPPGVAAPIVNVYARLPYRDLARRVAARLGDRRPVVMAIGLADDPGARDLPPTAHTRGVRVRRMGGFVRLDEPGGLTELFRLESQPTTAEQRARLTDGLRQLPRALSETITRPAALRFDGEALTPTPPAPAPGG